MAHAVTPDAVAISVTRDAQGNSSVAIVPPIDVTAERAKVDARFTTLRQQQEAAVLELNEAIARAQAESDQQLKDVAAALDDARTAAATLPIRHDTPIEQQIAIIGYEAMRLYAASQGDVSLRPWAVAESYARAVLLQTARQVVEGVANTAEETHEAWRTLLAGAGWTYGPQKDVIGKTDPMLVPWPDLTDVQRTQPTLFLAVAHALLNR